MMTPSKVFDEVDGEAYPDPLSVKYVNSQLSSLPEKHTVSILDIEKFWLFMQNNYGVSQYDDILLTLNGVPYIGSLEPGDVIYKISMNDLKNFNAQKKPGKE